MCLRTGGKGRSVRRLPKVEKNHFAKARLFCLASLQTQPHLELFSLLFNVNGWTVSRPLAKVQTAQKCILLL